jgi:cytochrome c-type biogenesis protein CcmE
VKARTKFLIGGFCLLSGAGYLMATSIEDTGQYFLTPQELATKIERDPSFYGTGLKLGARVVSGSIVRSPGGKEVAFRVTDGARTYPVVYRGIIPDTFTDSVDVVVEGRLARDGTFHATTLLAKCASRYENAPDKYRDTPGYRQRYGPNGPPATPAPPAGAPVGERSA